MDFVRRWSEATEIGAGRFVGWLGVSSLAQVLLARTLRPRQRAQRLGSPGFLAGGLGEAGDHQFSFEEPAGGLPAADVHDAGRRYRGGESVERLAGTGASRPIKEMERKAVAERDGVRFNHTAASALAYRCLSYLNISGTFYYLCSVLDSATRPSCIGICAESMTEAEIEIILQRAKEKHPEAKPRIISDNGPQFIARDFKVHSAFRA